MERGGARFVVDVIADNNLCYNNTSLFSPRDFQTFLSQVPESSIVSDIKYAASRKRKPTFIIIRDRFVFPISQTVEDNHIALCPAQLTCLHKAVGDTIKVQIFIPPPKIRFEMLKLYVMFEDPEENTRANLEIAHDEITKSLSKNFHGQIFAEDHRFSFRCKNICFDAVVVETQKKNPTCTQGKLGKKTNIRVFCSESTHLKIIGAEETQSVYIGNLDLSDIHDLNDRLMDIEVGGMVTIVKAILSEAFATRTLSPEEAKRRRIKHSRGMLLYGPSGSGKTYLATKICQLINTVEPKIVKGPELKSKWFGDTEWKIRSVFEDAAQDNQLHGVKSKLHVIIFDEIDSIAPIRRVADSASSRVEESAVSELLVMMDGPGAMSNIFMIGTTNRKDLIEPALLRPGRLGMSFEVGYPDQACRFEMLKVILQSAADDHKLDNDVDMEELAVLTESLSAASLRALLNEAISFALERNGWSALDLNYKMEDFIRAIEKLPKKQEAATEETQALQYPKPEKLHKKMEEMLSRLVKAESKIKWQGKFIGRGYKYVKETEALSGDRLKQTNLHMENLEKTLQMYDEKLKNMEKHISKVEEELEALKVKDPGTGSQ